MHFVEFGLNGQLTSRNVAQKASIVKERGGSGGTIINLVFRVAVIKGKGKERKSC